MPIKPENKNRYPSNWKEISQGIRVRANNKCEFCGVANYSFVNKKTRELCLQSESDAVKIILTVAHLDHIPENCNETNLRALCQKCHNTYDINHRKCTRKQTKAKHNLIINF